jgi:hypothetical protein
MSAEPRRPRGIRPGCGDEGSCIAAPPPPAAAPSAAASAAASHSASEGLPSPPPLLAAAPRARAAARADRSPAEEACPLACQVYVRLVRRDACMGAGAAVTHVQMRLYVCGYGFVRTANSARVLVRA